MKICQINCVYGHGSTGLLVRQLHESLLSEAVESTVCCGRGAAVKERGVWKLCGETYARANGLLHRIWGLPYGGCYFSTKRLLRFLEKEKPDLVHLHCINGHFVNIYRLVSWLRDHKIKTVVTLHAEFLFTGNCDHALECEKWRTGCGNCPRYAAKNRHLDWTACSFRKMEAAFRGFEDDLTVVSVSPWLRRRAEAAPILQEGKHCTVLNGVDTSVFAYRPCVQTAGAWVVFHATAMFCDDPGHLKGGWYVLELARRLRHLPIQFVVAGKYKLQGRIPGNVTLLGEIRDREQLAQHYRAADVTLLTSRRETFSMVCAESLCCGTPVVGFEAGGPESIALREFSRFVPWGDLDSLETAILEERNAPRRDKAAISRQAGEAYGLETMLRAYRSIYSGV